MNPICPLCNNTMLLKVDYDYYRCNNAKGFQFHQTRLFLDGDYDMWIDKLCVGFCSNDEWNNVTPEYYMSFPNANIWSSITAIPPFEFKDLYKVWTKCSKLKMFI